MSGFQPFHLLIVLFITVAGVFIATGLILATIVMVKEIKYQLRRRR